MTYKELLKRTHEIAPGDRKAADEFCDLLALSLQIEKLTGTERRYLYRLRKRWEARAVGQDPRWEIYGTKPGATNVQRQQRTHESRDPEILQAPSPAVANTEVPGDSRAQGSTVAGSTPAGSHFTKARTKPDVDEDPLVASLLKKYGRPGA